MSGKWKSKVSKSIGSNVDFNRKILRIKESWDEVDRLLQSIQTKSGKK